MTLTPEQYERLIDAADWYLEENNRDPSDYGPFIAAARADLAAMRQPIAAEAIQAHGWRETYKTEQYGGIWEFSPPEKFDNTCLWAYSVECGIDGTFKRVVDSRNQTVPGAHVMHDIAELERLLGGAK